MKYKYKELKSIVLIKTYEPKGTRTPLEDTAPLKDRLPPPLKFLKSSVLRKYITSKFPSPLKIGGGVHLLIGVT